MSGVLFVSQNPLDRAENIRAVWGAYDGPKVFRHGVGGMVNAEAEGFAAVVCDCLPARIRDKSRVRSVNLGHGLTGGKLYGADEKWKPWFDAAAASQTDFAISSSEAGIPIVAGQLGIPEDRVLPLGFPRTDAYFSDGPKMDRSALGYRRVYLYAPTFRYESDGWLPRIDWQKVDGMLAEDEAVVVKRHYFTERPLAAGGLRHVREICPDEPSTFFLRSCDVILTDYSSILFDAYILGKPAVLTVDDMDRFIGKRGMYHPFPDFYSSRWIAAEGNEEALVSMLREAADNGMGETERRCVEAVAGACDGSSVERVCDLIRSLT